jgi:hypothetical protein
MVQESNLSPSAETAPAMRVFRVAFNGFDVTIFDMDQHATVLVAKETGCFSNLLHIFYYTQNSSREP